jgi:hypothetical protein
MYNNLPKISSKLKICILCFYHIFETNMMTWLQCWLTLKQFIIVFKIYLDNLLWSNSTNNGCYRVNFASSKTVDLTDQVFKKFYPSPPMSFNMLTTMVFNLETSSSLLQPFKEKWLKFCNFFIHVYKIHLESNKIIARNRNQLHSARVSYDMEDL